MPFSGPSARTTSKATHLIAMRMPHVAHVWEDPLVVLLARAEVEPTRVKLKHFYTMQPGLITADTKPADCATMSHAQGTQGPISKLRNADTESQTPPSKMPLAWHHGKPCWAFTRSGHAAGLCQSRTFPKLFGGQSLDDCRLAHVFGTRTLQAVLRSPCCCTTKDQE